jgi:2-keto-myo-inositol isomerase
MNRSLSRRELMVCAGVGLTAAVMPGAVAAAPAAEKLPAEPFGYCLNTGTIRGQKLGIVEEAEVAAKAGYRGLEPWISVVQDYADRGGSLADLKKRIADLGLVVPSAIGFADWLGDDDAKRKAGLEQMRRDMQLVAAIGGTRIAAAPGGAYAKPMELAKVTERYRSLLEMGRQMGVVPQLELWGGSKTLHRLGEVAYVIVEAAHPDACPLLDAFHIYKGGSDFAGLRLFNGAAMHVFHINDYPAEPPRDKVTDAHRVYPGDGVAPLSEILRWLHASGFRGLLSLEVFNREYWKQDALAVARTGLEKVKAAVHKALG